MTSVVVGRERELAEANGFLAEAACRSCGLLLVGEAGMGKTTVWSAVVEEAGRRDFGILVARPSEAEADLAFAVLTDLLARVDAAALAGLPGVQRTALEQALRRSATSVPSDPLAVALATLGVLRRLAGSSPLLAAIDDLQWVDAPSLRALTFAVRRLDQEPIGLVATVRAGFDLELTRLAEGDGGSLERILVGGLTKRQLAQLVFERTGQTLSPPQLGRIAQLSAGSPYYALELAPAGGAEAQVPGTLAVALRARFGRISSSARAIGLLAAVLGRFDPRVTGSEHAPAILELRAAGVVDDRTGALWFSHPLLASTLLDMHDAEERRAAHLAIASAVDDPDERALHLGRGTEERSEAVAAELERAADRQDSRGAPETAAALAERAAALTPEDDVAARTRRIMRAADLHQAAGEGREHVYPSLEHLADVLPAGPDRARVLVRLGWLGAQIDTITGPDAIEYQERALAEADGAADVAVAAHAVLARMRGLGGNYRAALEHAELAAAARRRPDRWACFRLRPGSSPWRASSPVSASTRIYSKRDRTRCPRRRCHRAVPEPETSVGEGVAVHGPAGPRSNRPA